MKTRILSTVAAIIGMLFVAKAQEPNIKPCGSSEYRENLIKSHPELVAQFEKFQKYQSDFINNYKKHHLTTIPQKYIIPIVFHIIHNYGPENISDAQVMDEIRILNQDYAKLNPDTNVVVSPFNDIIGTANIEWRLAQIDPNGNCTNGIERIPSLQTYIGEEGAKINQWPRDQYMNVWVVSNILNYHFNAAGYALFPSDVAGSLFPLDGVMILSSYIGSIGTGAGYSSRALTHELGHTLSLLHPFGGSNSCGVACGSAGIYDLPSTFGFCSCPDPIAVTCNVETVTGSYNFIWTDTTTGTIDPTPVSVTYKNPANSNMDTLLTISPFSAAGVSANSSQSQAFAFSKWDTGAVNHATSIDSMKGILNLNKYYQVTLGTINYGKAFSMTSVSFTAGRTASGPRTFAVRSSLDNYTNNLVVSPSSLLDAIVIDPVGTSGPMPNTVFITQDTVTPVQCLIYFNSSTNAAQFAYRHTPVTFRFYAWNAEDTIGAFVLDQASVSFQGGINENVQNFMDYSYCSHMFTNGQVASMIGTLTNTDVSVNSGRINLWSTPNLIATGVLTPADSSLLGQSATNTAYALLNKDCSGGQLPHAVLVSKSSSAFGSVDNEVCTGTAIFFVDESWGGKITSRRWTFPSGTPSSSTLPSQSVTYSTSGWKDVSLWVQTDSSKTDSIYVSKKVYVSPTGSAEYATNFSEGFENQAEFDTAWFVNNYSNNATKWHVTNLSAYSGTYSVVMNGFYNPTIQNPFDTNAGDVDDLISPSIDLTAASAPYYLSYKYSYATRTYNPANMAETFVVLYSVNCGKTWGVLDSSLTTMDNPTHTGKIPAISVVVDNLSSFIPTYNLWSERYIALPAAVLGKSDVRFKFEFKSGIAYDAGGNVTSFANNLYLDDINISSVPQSIKENAQQTYSLNVYPNPANGAATVTYQIQAKQNVDLSIYDVLGNKVVSLVSQTQEEGYYSYSVNKQNLAPGLYFIRLNVNNKSSAVKKFILME